MRPVQPLLLLIFFTNFFLFARAQNKAVNGWLFFYNTYKVNNSFTFYFDGQVRSNNQFKKLQTAILRPGIQYNFSRKVNATLGYAFIENRRTIGSVSGYAPEHRIWEQVQVIHPVSFMMVLHRFRLEQRFISTPVVLNNELHTDGNTYANRFRYFLRDVIPFNGKKKFSKGVYAVLQNEIFINIGDKSPVNGKYFDQNRAYAATGFRFSPKFDLEAGYLNQYISGQSKFFTNNHNIQLASYIRL